MKLKLYDTTLRDGTQSRGLQFSLEDKLHIAKSLDHFGIPYIEAGWPGSNPKDAAFFKQAAKQRWNGAKIVAFGATCKPHQRAEHDANLQALLDAQTSCIALVGKAWDFHVTEILQTTLSENLRMIETSIRWMKQHGKEVVFDAEHFFDGCQRNSTYAMQVVETACRAGADWVVLCDTNGGMLPENISSMVRAVGEKATCPLGIHAHNDCELAVANSLAAVSSGAQMIQGTINGYGERCGNANLTSLIPTLQLKMGKPVTDKKGLAQLAALAHKVSDIANLSPNHHAAYVGKSAFAHKGGIHAAAVAKQPASYEHIPPQWVGNERHIVVSELAGRKSILLNSSQIDTEVMGNPAAILNQIKNLEYQGYQFENAEASYALLVLHQQGKKPDYFELQDVTVLSEKRNNQATNEAVLRVKVGQVVRHEVHSGNGPVHALDQALRKALLPTFPDLKHVALTDYKVRILNPQAATSAKVRVWVEASANGHSWRTIGVSTNIIQASAQALRDSYLWFLFNRNQRMTLTAATQAECSTPHPQNQQKTRS